MANNGKNLGVEEDYFPPDFVEYTLMEQLRWSRRKLGSVEHPNFGWVFWSEQDHEIEPSLSFDNCADFNPNVCANPKVRDNIRRALQKLILSSKLTACLVQFWAVMRTSEGRTLLTIRYQPFALAPTHYSIDRQRLCEYRMKLCSSEYNNCFYADALSGEEQLGLPGRVFLHKFPESTPDVKYYTTKEYPQRDLALLCKIRGSWAVPVFEHSSQTSVGVLEVLSPFKTPSVLDEGSFLRRMCKIFQEFGLQCFDGYKICEMQSRERIKRKRGLTAAFQELNNVLRSVCQIHELPLAMTWVPCNSCKGLRRLELGSVGVEFCFPRRDVYHTEFLEASKCSHLRKGLVAGWTLSHPVLLYCPNISQLSLDEYPLVPYARQCKLSGWFMICLQNVCTGTDIYVLEFFLSATSKGDEKILSTLSFILGTMEDRFTTFRFASGKELGALMSVEVIYFENDQKFRLVQEIQATRNFSSRSSDLSSKQSSGSVASTRPGFQDANMVTTVKFDLDSDSDPSSVQSSARVSNARPGFQDGNMVTIKAKYASSALVLKLSLPCRLYELQQKVTKGLMLEAGSYHVCYEDELGELILIACDEDLQDCVDDSLSLGNTSTVVLLEPKEPATNLNPPN